MAWMFHEASSFTGDVTNWNTGAVTDMTGMFSGALSFNGDVSKLNTDMADRFADDIFIHLLQVEPGS